jgi:hypothetical protein
MKTLYTYFLYNENTNMITVDDEEVDLFDNLKDVKTAAASLLIAPSSAGYAVAIFRLESVGRKSEIIWDNAEETEEPIKEIIPRKRPKLSDIDPIHTRQNTHWSSDDDDKLCQSLANGQTRKHIAHELERTEKAVTSRITVLRNRQIIPLLKGKNDENTET